MTKTEEMFAKLAAPFPIDRVKWRITATSGERGLPVCYIDARDVMERLDQVVGPEGWSTRLRMSEKVAVCELTLQLPEDRVTRTDAADFTNVEPAKGGASDALKRAAVQFGVARYMYDIDAPWVKIEAKGKIPKASLTQLDKFMRSAMSGAPVPASSAKETPSRGAPKPAASASGKAPKRTDEQRKKMFRANFQALESVSGMKADDIDAPLKWEPMNWALGKLGYNVEKQVPEDMVDRVLAGIKYWEQKGGNPDGDKPKQDAPTGEDPQMDGSYDGAGDQGENDDDPMF